MKRYLLRFLNSMMLPFLLSILVVQQAVVAEGNEVLIRGQMVNEKCVTKGKLSGCYLQKFDNSPWVVFTRDKKLYKVVPHRVGRWRLDNGFGKEVIIKGILKGNKILVNDVAPLGGKKKMSKACL